ncbi:serine/threonine-protein kinase [Candidatus Laterigemmans baculatus]|uniref:serine/threonine-protein kinase n=1 Tax=Candidatus Laterigemmans baculatus TaxID=2770505 RepID=UPI00193AE07B|nr:serine/threonine-protein kinase [Candidatus Laterigemmans baculatus]
MPQRMPKVRQTFGKYRIERRIAEGGFAVVYQAYDKIEGIRVALKIPYNHLLNSDVLDFFRKEVRLAATLRHPHILQLKNAEFIDDHFVLAYPLADESLADRLQRRLGTKMAIDYASQMLQAVACAHRARVIHCDIKPENLLLFPDNQLVLSDFGIARLALRTIRGSGSGTVGYIAPEQAMGRPSFRSDVFSMGLLLFRMFSGQLPEWPFDWPPPGSQRLRTRVPAELVDLIRRAIDPNPRKRFRDAMHMARSYEALQPKLRRFLTQKSTARKTTTRSTPRQTTKRKPKSA